MPHHPVLEYLGDCDWTLTQKPQYFLLFNNLPFINYLFPIVNQFRYSNSASKKKSETLKPLIIIIIIMFHYAYGARGYEAATNIHDRAPCALSDILAHM